MALAARGIETAALDRSGGARSTDTNDDLLDTRPPPHDLVEWYVAEMDRTSSTMGRCLQAYLDTLDFSPYLKEVETPTLLLVGEESPT